MGGMKVGKNIPIAPDVKYFGSYEEKDIVRDESEQNFVAGAIQRFVSISIDLHARKD